MSEHAKSVAVDLDGVLAQYDGWKGLEHIGDPIPGAREFLKALYDDDYHIIIHTARCRAKVNDVSVAFPIINKWLNDHGMICSEIWTGRGKPIAAAYVDDRAVACTPQDVQAHMIPRCFRGAIERIKHLTRREA